MTPKKQMLPILRGVRKQLKRASPIVRQGKMSREQWEGLWSKYRYVLALCHQNNLVSDFGFHWLSVREHVFTPNYGLKNESRRRK